MKNTKILFIRLYIGTLYSNFIVPLRGSNYIQLLYCDPLKGLATLFGKIRWLVWQERINELGQHSGNIRAAFQLLQPYSNTTSEIKVALKQLSWAKLGKIRQKIRSIRIKSGQKIGADRGESGRKMRVACDQMLPNATRKQGDQRRPKATKIQVTKSDQRCPKREDITYQRLILLNSSFMFCVGQKLL